MPIMITRALKVAGIMCSLVGVIALASSSIEAMAATVSVLAFAMACVVTWYFLEETGQ